MSAEVEATLPGQYALASSKADALLAGNAMTAPTPPNKRVEALANADPSSLSEEQLSDVLVYWAAYSGYARHRAAIARGESVVSTALFEMEFDARYHRSTSSVVSDKRHAVGNEPAVRNLKLKAVYNQRDAGILEAAASAAEMRYSAISREMTRRQRDLETR